MGVPSTILIHLLFAYKSIKSDSGTINSSAELPKPPKLAHFSSIEFTTHFGRTTSILVRFDTAVPVLIDSLILHNNILNNSMFLNGVQP